MISAAKVQGSLQLPKSVTFDDYKASLNISCDGNNRLNMQFWLNYSDRKNHLERIQCERYKTSFHCGQRVLDSNKLHLFLLSDGTLIDNNKCLEILQNASVLIVCTEEKSTIFYDKVGFLVCCFKQIAIVYKRAKLDD